MVSLTPSFQYVQSSSTLFF